jgi:hypothetical protein
LAALAALALKDGFGWQACSRPARRGRLGARRRGRPRHFFPHWPASPPPRAAGTSLSPMNGTRCSASETGSHAKRGVLATVERLRAPRCAIAPETRSPGRCAGRRSGWARRTGSCGCSPAARPARSKLVSSFSSRRAQASAVSFISMVPVTCCQKPPRCGWRLRSSASRPAPALAQHGDGDGLVVQAAGDDLGLQLFRQAPASAARTSSSGGALPDSSCCSEVTPASEMPQGTMSPKWLMVRADVEGEAVGGDPAADVHADGASLRASCPSSPPPRPPSAGDARGLHPKSAAAADHRLSR